MDRTTEALRRKLQPYDDLSLAGPWLPGSERLLHPKPGRALVLVRADRPFEQVSERIVPRLRRDIDSTVKPPARAYMTGYADVGQGIHNSTVEALKRAELIAAPLLLVILLLVFRSPVAAALPLLLGGATVAASRGVLDIVNRFVELDIVALNLGSMMGLALGVDYSLLMVSRYREELAADRDPAEAARTAGATAGRTVLFAGVALVCAMVAATFVAPGAIMASSGAGTIVAVLISMASALTVLPALLVMLGDRVDRWRIGGAPPEDGGRWSRLGMRALRHPALAAALVLGLVLALAAPVLALESGPPDPGNLPASSRERQDFEHVAKTLGGGWSAPYEIVVAAKKGRITDPERLQTLHRWQQRLGDHPGVLAVTGPGEIAERAKGIGRMREGATVMRRELDRSEKGQEQLATGLDRVDSGVEQLRGGLAQAADGAGALEAGSSAGADGARRLHDGLQRAQQGIGEHGRTRSGPRRRRRARGWQLPCRDRSAAPASRPLAGSLRGGEEPAAHARAAGRAAWRLAAAGRAA